jgi:membrane-anchored mycosin MYCP
MHQRPLTRLLAAAAVALSATAIGPTHSGVAAEPAKCEEGVTRWVPSRSPALDRLSADRAWSLATGAGVVVAVIDSGVSTNNAHLTSGVLPGKSFVEGTATTDDLGHGTAVASIIAGRPITPQSGLVGLAKDATILPVRVYAKEDQDAERFPRLAEGIRWAADNGARVMNISSSSPSDNDLVRAAIAYAVERDVLVVASAGNRATASETSDGLRYPAAYPGVVGVSASDETDTVTDASIHGPQVAVAAPGYEIVAANRDWGDCVYGIPPALSVSYATAFVSASAALLRERFPQESAAQIVHRLQVTASRPQRDSRNDVSGWGVVQPYEAMTWVYDASVSGPVPPGAPPRVVVTPTPQALDLRPTPDPTAADRTATVWLLLLSGSAVLGLALWGMLRRGRTSP